MVARPHDVSRRRNPLIVTADPLLLEELLRLTADVGLIADVAPDPGRRARLVRPGDARAHRRRRGRAVRPGRAAASAQRDPRRACGRRRAGAHGPPDCRIAERLGAAHVALLPAAEPWVLEQLAQVDDDARSASRRGARRPGRRGRVGAGRRSGGDRRPARVWRRCSSTPIRSAVASIWCSAGSTATGLRWPALSGAGGRVHPSALVDALPGHGDLVVLSWDRGEPSRSPRSRRWAPRSTPVGAGRDLVVDRPATPPRRAGDRSRCRAADRAYLVVPAELRACAAAARVAATALPHAPGCRWWCANRVRPGCGSPRSSRRSSCRSPARSAPSRASSAALERGEPPASSGRGSLAALCDKLLASSVPPVRAGGGMTADAVRPGRRRAGVRATRAGRSWPRMGEHGRGPAFDAGPTGAVAPVDRPRPLLPVAGPRWRRCPPASAPAGLDDMPGAGVLTPLLLDPSRHRRARQPRRGVGRPGPGLVRVDVSVGSPADVRRLAQRLASACGRRLDEACPFVDARLPDGTRLHAVLPPVATDGPYLSLRTFRHRAFTLADLVACGTLGAARRRPARRDRRGPAVLPGQRRHRHRQDDDAEHDARPGAAHRAHRGRRGLARAPARPSARGRAVDAYGQRRGRGHGDAARPAAAGAADATRPARRRRVPWRRGGRPARRAEHRSRGRRRHAARQHGRRRAGPAGGTRVCSAGCRGRPCTPRSRRRSRSSSTCGGLATGRVLDEIVVLRPSGPDQAVSALSGVAPAGWRATRAHRARRPADTAAAYARRPALLGGGR